MRTPRRVLDAQAARLAAADLLSRHAWTRADLAARLERRGAPAEIAADVVADLVARGHVDDATFARDWVAARAGRGYGTARLRAELRTRGVASALIDAALGAVSRDASADAARAAARRRLPALARAPERVATRLRDYLMRRGYPAGLAVRIAKELTGADDASRD